MRVIPALDVIGGRNPSPTPSGSRLTKVRHWTTIRKDHRWDYGEDRFRLTGAIEQRVFVVIYTLRANSVRIISARKANRRELKDYENKTNQNRLE